jgi:hypothetical protein
MNALVCGLPTRRLYSDLPVQIFRKLRDFDRVGPAGSYAMLDEREDSINDGGFYTDQWNRDNPSGYEFKNWLASYHHRAGAFNFADGHSEIKKTAGPTHLSTRCSR